MINSNNNGDSKEKIGGSWAEVLAKVKNPLVFFALALLVIEASLAAIIGSGKLEANQTFWSVIIMAVLFLFVILVVTILTYRVPANLMAQLKSVAQTEAKKVSEDTTRAVILSQNLRRLKYELGAFNEDALIDSSQENKRQEGLRQNPLLIYVGPTIEGILKNPQLSTSIDQETRAKLEKLLSSPRYSVGRFLAQIDEIIQELD
jgi:hypothetical protein